MALLYNFKQFNCIRKIINNVYYLSVNKYHNRRQIGNREVVGYGFNGGYNYVDRVDCPYPAIRFRRPSAEFDTLREKEKNDWNSLSLEEKKKLYRFSFRQTLVEALAPTGEWKVALSLCFVAISVAVWIFILQLRFARPDLPESCTPENRKKELEFYIQSRKDPIDGLASKWDYENNRWKFAK